MIDVTLGVMILSALFAYLSWQRVGFEKESEIETRLINRFDNNYDGRSTNYQYSITEVNVEESGFPISLYKYIPFKEHEGFADLRSSFWPKDGKEFFRMASRREIQEYELTPPNVELRQCNWEGRENDYADLLVRVNSIHHREISNAIKIVLAAIYELNTGVVDEEFRDQLTYIGDRN